MQLDLDRLDLDPQYRNINCSQTTFEHFTEQVKTAIRVVGRAVFYDYKGTPNESYNAIYPPKMGGKKRAARKSTT